MTTRIKVPRIVSKLLETSHKCAGAQIDTERMCCLVSDDEWGEIIEYVRWFPTSKEVSDPFGVSSMRFAGIEVVKRSALRT